MPKISVIMPAYNAEKYIGEAIDSILGQSFTDFEFLILNDCSTDRTEEIILSYDDPRIIYLKNERNLGVAATLNRGLAAASGEYIARMDADDISLPERFQKQVDFLDSRPDVAVVASAVELFGAQKGIRIFSKTPEQLAVDLLTACCFAHPSVMMRAGAIRETGGYDSAFDGAEDYHLWVRLAQRYHLGSLPEVLLRYRTHPAQVTQRQNVQSRDLLLRKIREMQVSVLGLACEGLGFDAFFAPGADNLPALNTYLEDMLQANEKMKRYDQTCLKQYVYAVRCGVLDRMGFRQAAAAVSSCGISSVGYLLRRLASRVKSTVDAHIGKQKLRRKLKVKDFSILSNNCWGGTISQKYGLPYRSPTVGLYIPGDDFVKFCGDWQNYLRRELEFIPWEQARLYPQIKDQKPYPVAKLGDIEVYFMHYSTPSEAKEKWGRRAARINPDRLIFKLSQRECCSREDVERFMALPHPNKVCFAYDNVPGIVCIPELEGLSGEEQGYIQEKFDELAFINRLK